MNGNKDNGQNLQSLKGNMTLDFGGQTNAKRSRVAELQQQWQLQTPSGQVILESPDVKKFGWSTPEIEKMIQGVGATPTPSQALSFDPPMVKEADVAIGGGDNDQPVPVSVAAIERSQSQAPQQSATQVQTSTTHSLMSGGHFYSANEHFDEAPSVLMNLNIKQEMSDDTATPPPSSMDGMAPIDMVDQERIKLERKRLRNRIAATKCRRNKLEKIAQLEEKVKHLRSENGELRSAVSRQRDYVSQLKQVIMEHAQHGCEIMDVQ